MAARSSMADFSSPTPSASFLELSRAMLKIREAVVAG
jgi:hypothetical protein